jgi:putative transposase
VEKLQEGDRLLSAGQAVGQVLQVLGVSDATYHRWRNQYGGM